MTKILIVEDLETDMELIMRILDIYGYEHVYAFNGLQAIEKVMSDSPDLIVMDLELPILDGWSAISKIKSMDIGKDIPIIALSAYSTEYEIQKAKNCGVSEYLTKPITNFDHFIKVIKSYG